MNDMITDLMNGDGGARQLAGLMRDPKTRLAPQLKQEVGELGDSPAAIVADVINVQRADVKRLARAHDVDVHVEMMTEDRAAELIAGVLDDEGHRVVQVFNDLAEKRNKVLVEVLDEEEHQQFMAAKREMMMTGDPDTFETDVDDVDPDVDAIEESGSE